MDRGRLLETLNSVNYGLPIGAFAADLSNGEVRFKSALLVGSGELDGVLLRELLASSAEMVRAHYGDVVRAVTGKPHEH